MVFKGKSRICGLIMNGNEMEILPTGAREYQEHVGDGHRLPALIVYKINIVIRGVRARANLASARASSLCVVFY